MNTDLINPETIQPSIEGPEIRLFTEKAIAIGTALGGPIVGGYLIAQNYKSLNQHTAAKYSLIIGMVIIGVFFPLLLLIPEHLLTQIPNQIFELLWAGVAYFVVTHYQKESIESHLEKRGKKGSGWIVFLSGIIGAGITFAYIFAIASIIAPREQFVKAPENLAPLYIGHTQGILYYDSLTIDVRDAKVVGSFLTELGYYSKEQHTESAYFKKDSIYYINLMVDERNWNKHQVQQGNEWIKMRMSITYPNRYYNIILTSVNSSGEAKQYIVE